MIPLPAIGQQLIRIARRRPASSDWDLECTVRTWNLVTQEIRARRMVSEVQPSSCGEFEEFLVRRAS